MPSFAFSGLRFRIFVLISLAMLPALGLILYTASEQRSQQEADTHADTMQVAKLASKNLEQLVNGTHQVLAVLSELPAVQDRDAASCNTFFSAFKKRLPMYNNIGAINLQGNIFCSASPLKKRVNVSDRPYYKSVVKNKKPYFGEYQSSRIDGKPTIIAASPVFDKQQRLQAIVYVALDFNWFKEQLNKYKLPEQATLAVLDRNGTILYRNIDTEKWIGRNMEGLESVKTMFTLQEGVIEAVGIDGLKRIYAFTTVHGTDKGMYVRSGISRAVVFSDINLMLLKNLSVLLIIACLAYVIAWFGGNFFIMHRVRLLMKASEELSKGNLGTRVEVTGHRDEIGQLGESFNRMAEALEQQNEERRKSEEKYRALFEESKDAIFVSTPEGKYLDINPAGVELLGYASREEMFRLDINTDVYLNPESRKAYAQLLHEQGYVKDYELEFRRKDGGKLTVLSTTTTLRDENGNVIAYRGINRDITERKKLEQQLLHAQKMEAVGRLAGGIAHDFNNILSTILGYGDLLKKKIDNPDTVKEYIDQILRAGNRAVEVTRNLLAFSRKQAMNPTLININDLVTKFEKMLSRIIGEDIEIITELHAEDIICKADAGQIEQVLMNLATNARDAMPQGGKLFLRTGRADMDQAFMQDHFTCLPGTYAMISVSDTGIGMTEETLKQIFEPFFTTKEPGKGTGLGLAMIYGIMQQHLGCINVASEPGKGTSFQLYFPVTKLKKKSTAPVAAKRSPKGKMETILVAEDDDELRSLTEIVLTQHGYNIIVARDGVEAIEKYIEHEDSIQLVLMDVIMPKKSGKEAYERIKEIHPDAKIIFMSGYAADFLHQGNAFTEPITLITKPYSSENLLLKVKEALKAHDRDTPSLQSGHPSGHE
jgi:two-component system, cell cycle sensor histidine kinase and response regulator CckA